MGGQEQKVRGLLKAGADPNFRASKETFQLDMTPLTWCAYAGYTKAIALFVDDKRTNVNLVVQTEDGGRITALDIARKIGERGADAAELLKKAGALTYSELQDGPSEFLNGLLPPGDVASSTTK